MFIEGMWVVALILILNALFSSIVKGYEERYMNRLKRVYYFVFGVMYIVTVEELWCYKETWFKFALGSLIILLFFTVISTLLDNLAIEGNSIGVYFIKIRKIYRKFRNKT
jgi:hypothetical protein